VPTLNCPAHRGLAALFPAMHSYNKSGIMPALSIREKRQSETRSSILVLSQKPPSREEVSHDDNVTITQNV